MMAVHESYSPRKKLGVIVLYAVSAWVGVFAYAGVANLVCKALMS